MALPATLICQVSRYIPRTETGVLRDFVLRNDRFCERRNCYAQGRP